MRNSLLFFLIFCFLTIIKANHPGYLGISIRDFSNNKFTGVQIVNVFDDGAAKQYGLKENDIITAINNVVLFKRNDLTTQLNRYNWSDKVNLIYIRNGIQIETNVYLGYKSTTRTYNVKKMMKEDGEHWLFTDDNTDILLDAEEKLVSISKDDNKGNIEAWNPNNDNKKLEVPQYFLDTEDKMYCINRIKEEQKKKKSKANEIVFIKTITQENKIKVNDESELIVESFSIFPNPSNGIFDIKIKAIKSGVAQINIFNVSGKIIRTEKIENDDGYFYKQINMDNEPKGAYLLQLNIGNKIVTKKIVLQ